MRDTSNPDDRAHLMADCPPCRDCRHFWPTGMMGFARAGRILDRNEGTCKLHDWTVDGDVSMAHSEPCGFEGRP